MQRASSEFQPEPNNNEPLTRRSAQGSRGLLMKLLVGASVALGIGAAGKAEAQEAEFDLASLPSGATIDLIDRLGGAIPAAIDGLKINDGLRTAMKGFPFFVLKGMDSLTEVPVNRDAAWTTYFDWLREMGYQPLGLAADALPNPDTQWECPTDGNCQGYYEAALGKVKPIVDRVNSGATAPDAVKAQEFLNMAEDSETNPLLHRRLMYVAAAWQSLDPKYQAFYKAKVDGREALTSLPADGAGLDSLVGQEVTFFQWGQEAVKGRVTSVTLPVAAVPAVGGTLAVAAAPATITVQPVGSPAPAPVTLTATEINGTPATTGATPTAAAPATARVFVEWPEEWEKARAATSYHGRNRIADPLNPTTGLQAFIGHNVEVVKADGTSAVGVLEAADVSGAMPTYTLQGKSAVGFNAYRNIFFVGSKVGVGGTAVSQSERLSLGPTVFSFGGADGDTSVVGGGGGVTANYRDLFPHVDGEAVLGYAGHGSSSEKATKRGTNPSAFVALAALKPHVTLGPVNLGLKLGGGAMAGGGALTAGAYASSEGGNQQFEGGINYLRLLGAEGTPEERLGNPLPDRLNVHGVMANFTWRYRLLKLFE